MSSNAALDRAMSGQKVEGTAAVSGLKAATEKLKSMKSRLETAKENAGTTATAAMHAGETLGTTFVASTAEGYFGRDKLKPGGVPLRAVGGFLLGGWGLAAMISGDGGGHQLAIGTGLLASEGASLGVLAGQALKEKMAKDASANANGGAAQTPANPAAPANTPAAPAATPAQPQVKGIAADDVGALARTIRMTPGTEGERRPRGGWVQARRNAA